MNIPLSIERIVLALWVGGLWTVGLLVAPELFRSLESRQVAGLIAGKLFTAVNYAGLVAGFILLVLVCWQHSWRSYRQWRSLLVGAMLILVATSQFVLMPMMQEIMQARLETTVVNHEMQNQFALLHGVSSGLYLVTSLIGLVLVVAGVTRRSG